MLSTGWEGGETEGRLTRQTTPELSLPFPTRLLSSVQR